MMNLFKMAYRNLLRHRRRSLLSALALSVAFSLSLFMAAFFKGEMRSSLEKTLQLSSGHIQVQSASYDPDKLSVAWEYLIENPEQIAGQIASSPLVKFATPRLVASGIVSSGDQSTGVQIMGVDPASAANDPYKNLTSGTFITPDDRDGIVIGYPLAENMGLKAGDKLNVLVNTAEGNVDEQSFTIRGIYTTGSSTYDKGIVFLPLAKLQSFSGAGNHASFIFVILNDREQAETVAGSITGSGYTIKTWREMNELLVVMDDYANVIISIMSTIVLAVAATVIINTMLMSVFERTREIGILSALGMKGYQITNLFLVEALLLGLGGIALGLLFGSGLAAYFGSVGIYFGDLGVSGMVMGDRLYPYQTLGDTLNLTTATLFITVVFSLYPAYLASRMEPVAALRAEK